MWFIEGVMGNGYIDKTPLKHAHMHARTYKCNLHGF